MKLRHSVKAQKKKSLYKTYLRFTSNKKLYKRYLINKKVIRSFRNLNRYDPKVKMHAFFIKFLYSTLYTRYIDEVLMYKELEKFLEEPITEELDKKTLLKYARRIIYRYLLNGSSKNEALTDIFKNFTIPSKSVYNNYTRLIDYYKYITRLNKSSKKKLRLFKNQLDFLHPGKWVKLLNSKYLTNVVLEQYKSLMFDDPSYFDNKYILKWGRVTIPFHKKAKKRSYWSRFKYNYLYFNISVLRFLQLKKYVNKLLSFMVRFFVNNYKKLTADNKVKLMIYLKKNLYFLLGRCSHLYKRISKMKEKYQDHLDRKANKINELSSYKRMKRIGSVLKMKHVKDLYLSYIKRIFLRYLRANIHFKFTKSNIFVSLTNHKGEIRLKNSIGLLGYKKDKKKTYYASKELIINCVPRLFKAFKMQVLSVRQSTKFTRTNLFKSYLDILRNYYGFNFTYGVKKERSIKTKIMNIIYNTMKKYITMRLFIGGSRKRLRSLTKLLLRRLRDYKDSNKKYLSRMLFLVRNTKPHNGCRSPKKGRRKVRRRRQRLKIYLRKRNHRRLRKTINKRMHYISLYNLAKRKVYTKRNDTKFKSTSMIPYFRKRTNYSKMYNKKNQVANYVPNITPTFKHHFIYAGPSNPNVKKKKIIKERKKDNALLKRLKFEGKHNQIAKLLAKPKKKLMPIEMSLPKKYREWAYGKKWTHPYASKPLFVPSLTKKIQNIRKQKKGRKMHFYKISN